MLHNLSVKSVRLVNSSVKTTHRYFSTNPRVFELQQTRKYFNVNKEFVSLSFFEDLLIGNSEQIYCYVAHLRHQT